MRYLKNGGANAIRTVCADRPDAAPIDRVVGLSPVQIQRRFTAAARAAGIEGCHALPATACPRASCKLFYSLESGIQIPLQQHEAMRADRQRTASAAWSALPSILCSRVPSPSCFWAAKPSFKMPFIRPFVQVGFETHS